MRKTSAKIYAILLIAAFMAWLLTPAILMNIKGASKQGISKRENRVLAKRPEFNISLLDPFPAQYTKYYNDAFPYRESLIDWFTKTVSLGLFHKTPPNSGVDIGLDGWLFASPEKMVYEGTLELTPAQIEEIYQTIRNRVIFFKAKGIKLYVFFPPMKAEIYPEYLPVAYYRQADSTVTQKIVTRLQKDSIIPFIDVKPAILKAKEKGLQLYARTDNHWNARGAYEAYYQVISRIKKDFPEVKPVDPGSFRYKSFKALGGNLAVQLGTYKTMTEDILVPDFNPVKAREGKKAGYQAPSWFGYQTDFEMVRVVADSSLPTIVVIRDSFFNQLLPYFAENFSKSVYIFDAWQYELNWDIIQSEKPDIVLLEIFEPYTKRLIHVE